MAEKEDIQLVRIIKKMQERDCNVLLVVHADERFDAYPPKVVSRYMFLCL